MPMLNSQEQLSWSSHYAYPDSAYGSYAVDSSAFTTTTTFAMMDSYLSEGPSPIENASNIHESSLIENAPNIHEPIQQTYYSEGVSKGEFYAGGSPAAFQSMPQSSQHMPPFDYAISSSCWEMPESSIFSPASSSCSDPTTPSTPEETIPAPSVKQPRGRPRIERPVSSSSTVPKDQKSSSSYKQPVRRLPHNQVERRYRQNINGQLEQLRLAIPMLSQEDTLQSDSRSHKPSKGKILAGALDYIRCLEEDCANLTEELQDMRRHWNA